MKTEQLNYHLPPELIAQQPADDRTGSRLLVFERTSGQITDSSFSQIGDFLRQNDRLVLNNTKVLQARFFAQRSTGAKLEGLFLKERARGIWEVMLKGSRKLRPGERFYLKDRTEETFCAMEILEKKDQRRCILKLDTDLPATNILEEVGLPPLPPYIKRDTDAEQAKRDKLRYQTVYARKTGAVAAPTAGLHFTKELIEQLKGKGLSVAYLTLHVGAGTFRPITTENLSEHKMHSESFHIDEENARTINLAKEQGRRIIAVGTTSVRTLEAAAVDCRIRAGSNETALFITPGHKFKMVDCLLTNFHLPKSSLLALVAAFAGLENILNVYEHAIEQRYRFYSYGDAMLIV